MSPFNLRLYAYRSKRQHLPNIQHTHILCALSLLLRFSAITVVIPTHTYSTFAFVAPNSAVFSLSLTPPTVYFSVEYCKFSTTLSTNVSEKKRKNRGGRGRKKNRKRVCACSLVKRASFRNLHMRVHLLHSLLMLLAAMVCLLAGYYNTLTPYRSRHTPIGEYARIHTNTVICR